jgi:hypothetical protein
VTAVLGPSSPLTLALTGVPITRRGAEFRRDHGATWSSIARASASMRQIAA